MCLTAALARHSKEDPSATALNKVLPKLEEKKQVFFFFGFGKSMFSTRVLCLPVCQHNCDSENADCVALCRQGCKSVWAHPSQFLPTILGGSAPCQSSLPSSPHPQCALLSTIHCLSQRAQKNTRAPRSLSRTPTPTLPLTQGSTLGWSHSPPASVYSSVK